MANTLESVMRLTDNYTVTMSKIINSAQQGEKATKGAESSVKSLSGIMSGAASVGMTGLITKLGTMVTMAYAAKKAWDFLSQSIQTAATQQVQKSTFQSLLGSQQLGTDLNNFVTAYGRASSLGRENAASATTSFLSYTRNINQIKELLDLTQRLALRNPEQGAEGAVFALKEVLAGQTMSLRNRFNMNGVSPETVQQFYAKGDIQGAINYLNQVFNKFGATQGVVEANFNSLSVQAGRFKKNLMDSIGSESNGAAQTLAQTFINLNADMDAGKFQPFFNVMAQGTTMLANGISWVAQNANVLAPIIVGVTTAVVGYNIAMGTATLVTSVFNAAAGVMTGRVLAVAATVAAVAATAATIKGITDSATKSTNASALTTAQAAAAYAADQKKLGASTLGNSAGSIPTTVNNKDPIKVSGTVEIEKENLKYVFEASAAKFFATFNAQKVEPSVNIGVQNVSKTADVNEVDSALGNLLLARASASAGGKML